MRRTRWLQAVTVGALAASAAGLACETWALACRTIDLDDTSAPADGVWVDRDGEWFPPIFHPIIDATAASLAVALPSPIPVSGFRLPVPRISPRRRAVACAHSPRAPPACRHA